jgi:hypothetical protein
MGSGTSIGFAMLTWLGAVGPDVPAQAPSERGYSLEYRAAAGCPDAAAMAQAIETRTPGALQAPTNSAAVKLRVEVRDDGTSTLWIELPDVVSRREFPQAACVEAVTSMAVIASMVLEAEVSERAATTRSMMDRFDPITAPVEEAVVENPPLAVPPSPATTASRTTTLPPSRKGASAAADAPKRARARIALLAGVLVESAVASDAALGGSVGVALWLEPGRSRLWRPRLHAELLGTLPSTVRAGQGDVELRLLAGRLHVCPVSVPVVQGLRIVPCFTGDYGDLQGRGTGLTVNSRTRNMPWLALGGTLRAQLGEPRVFSLESWLGLRGLTRADTFGFAPQIPAHEVPHWSLGAGLDLAITLP